jgi:choline dehydrogenase-like flavoprotein
LEGGGRKGEERSQNIYDAEMAASKHAGTKVGRFRVFGGSSTRWGGQILPFTDDIFSPDPGLLSPSWPLMADVLTPYYTQIENILGANNLPFSTQVFQAFGMTVPEVFDSNPDIRLRFSKWVPFSRRNLAQTLGASAIASGNITVFLHANVMEYLLSPDGSAIEAFLVRNYRGQRFRFTADHYVSCTGTIETSRLLLASRSVCPEGVGNRYDQVGRGLHDHVSAAVAELKHSARNKMLNLLGPFFNTGTAHTARLEATPALRKRLNLLAVMAQLTIEEPEDSGIFLARQILRSIQRGELSSTLLDKYRQLPAASIDLLRLAYNAKIRKKRSISSKATVLLRILSEQRPQPHNRITLAPGSCDSLGVPKAVIDWRVSAEEIRSMRRYAQWLRDELDRLEPGMIDWYPDVMREDSECFSEIRDTNHPMGGTIMGQDISTSVVDTNLRLHGICNFYIASCSTFPAGGSSNPTFTLMALTLRLGEHLRKMVKRSQIQISLQTPILSPLSHS